MFDGFVVSQVGPLGFGQLCAVFCRVSFLSTIALVVALLVVAPYLAHRLRRRRAEEQPFPPARLVEPDLPAVS